MFNEANAVEDFIRDLPSGRVKARPGLGWEYVAREQLPRSASDVLVDSEIRGRDYNLNIPLYVRRPKTVGIWAR